MIFGEFLTPIKTNATVQDGLRNITDLDEMWVVEVASRADGLNGILITRIIATLSSDHADQAKATNT